MTLLDLVKHLRTSILDDTGGTGVCWDDIENDDEDVYQLKWSNEELTKFINEAEREACRTAFLLKDYGGDYDIAVTTGEGRYTLHPKVLKIKGAKLASQTSPLAPCEIEDIWLEPNWQTAAGTPEVYITDYITRTIRLWKAPVADDTLNLLVYRLPFADLSWGDNMESPEVPEHYHMALLNYAAFLAYNKDDANTFDPTRAQYFRALWEQDFPHRLSIYAEKRQKRNGGRSVGYGGIRTGSRYSNPYGNK